MGLLDNLYCIDNQSYNFFLAQSISLGGTPILVHPNGAALQWAG
jgi:hypothetical protein